MIGFMQIDYLIGTYLARKRPVASVKFLLNDKFRYNKIRHSAVIMLIFSSFKKQ